MAALGNDPPLLGSIEVPRLRGIHACPLRLGRHRVETARRAGTPRQLVVYRLGPDDIVEIPGLLHDRMVLSQAARRILQTADKA